mgnify:CR=1 FL=1
MHRGKAGRMQGNLAGIMCVMKGTPTTYNKDFQVPRCWLLILLLLLLLLLLVMIYL